MRDRIAARRRELQMRMLCYSRGENECGKAVGVKTLSNYIYFTRKELGMLALVEELLDGKTEEELSLDAEKAFDMLTEPNERHRNTRRDYDRI